MTLFKDALKARVGYFDYSDLATQTTPLAVTGGAGWVDIPNDAAGPYTDKTKKPSTITDIWDATNQQFDFSELGLGDMVNIRLDVIVVAGLPDTTIDIRMLAAIGSLIEYQLPYISDKNYKIAGTYQLIRFNGMHMGNAETLANPAKFQIKSDKNITVKVDGWYSQIFRLSI